MAAKLIKMTQRYYGLMLLAVLGHSVEFANFLFCVIVGRISFMLGEENIKQTFNTLHGNTAQTGLII